ncbi:hypothetical protein CFK38_04745 [Brachybacterium vulturis]|uniref:Polymerase nucleotidyl transferase domain-containing protein n=1 Tax=Brachybacterium vulturis TaxID=2017484 RepID=A0A291GK63_9MICO|nr:nucleotidyltransferase domain-containing protein [Brachybacterium vulturis]ATG50913.1 hypothetical protein CFK38_04745 [Brachybacterium vulturis]
MTGPAMHRKPLSGPRGRRVVLHRVEIRRLLEKHGYTEPEIFGSVARGDDGANSDIDILVDVPSGTSLLDIIGVQIGLEDLLGCSVDLVPRKDLKPRVRARAVNDLMPL